MAPRVLTDDFECRAVWRLHCVYGYPASSRVWEVKVERLVRAIS